MLGVVEASLSLVLLCSVVVAVSAWVSRQNSQVLAVVIVLLWLGAVWGGVSIGMSVVQECEFTSPASVKVVDEPEWQVTRVRFLARDSRGCRVLVTASRFFKVGNGDELKLYGGTISSLEEVSAYSKGYADYLERRKISATWGYAEIQILRSSGGLLKSWHEVVRRNINELLIEPDASLIKAMLLAERGTISEEIVAQFRATGVSHVLAISGLHISLLAGMVVGLFTLLPISPIVRTILVILLLWMYVMFIGAPISAVRAVCFWTIALLALRFHLLISLPTVILLAVTILLSINPLLVEEVGFQLSVSAVTGIFLVLFVTRNLVSRCRGAYRFFVSSILVSLGATLATAPLVVYHFENIALVGILANVLIVPVIPFVLMLSMASVVVSTVNMSVATVIAYLLHMLIKWMMIVTEKLSALSWLYIENISVTGWFVGSYYLCLIVLCVILMRWQKRSWREVWQ